MIDEIEKVREGWRGRAREVAKAIVAPRAAEIDEKGEFAWDLAEVYSRYGFLSLLIPKEYGGMDTDVTSFCLVAEEIASVCASSALLVIVQAVGTMPVVLGGTNELKQRVLPRLAQEKGLICFCLTEPDSGSDAASVRTKAVLEGDHYGIATPFASGCISPAEKDTSACSSKTMPIITNSSPRFLPPWAHALRGTRRARL